MTVTDFQKLLGKLGNNSGKNFLYSFEPLRVLMLCSKLTSKSQKSVSEAACSESHCTVSHR